MISAVSSPFMTGKAGDFRAAPERPEVDPAQQLLLPAAGRADTRIQWYDLNLSTCIHDREPPSPSASTFSVLSHSSMQPG